MIFYHQFLCGNATYIFSRSCKGGLAYRFTKLKGPRRRPCEIRTIRRDQLLNASTGNLVHTWHSTLMRIIPLPSKASQTFSSSDFVLALHLLLDGWDLVGLLPPWCMGTP